MRFLITAGPTREPIDPVRYLSNRSSGKMGYAIAEATLEAGHEVVLISGPVHLDPPRGARFISILTADEMHDAVHRYVRDCDILVMCAAVADYKPAKVSPQKIKKHEENLALELIPTRDILSSLPKKDRQFLVVGFAAETNDVEESAKKKLRAKNCDLIVANDVSRADSGMESDENEVTVLFQSGERQKISRAPKKIIARELLKIFSNMREKCLTKKM
ncbi:MAG TPA: bifunctional phosphopantothenoylcysteine decarboxylase/phosphopantothenate--cysteine ligase CoaBC [Chthoniobacterales bacterium]|nr:bifunctional phosphopantothenoylcysteine decarboxylase/phosphopantothenate--cysteine ligase CoaBC [Chthoniobacterales bacterium]